MTERQRFSNEARPKMLTIGRGYSTNDFTALNVALPAIEQDFDVDVGTVQWTVNAYALTYGMVLVTGGDPAIDSA